MLGIDPEGVFTSRALSRGGVWLSSVLLTAVAVIVMVLSTFPESPGDEADLSRSIVPVVSLGALGVAAYVVQRSRSTVATVIGLALLSVAAFSYGLSVEPLVAPGQKSDSIVLSLPVVAASVIGVGRRSLAACLVLCGFGYVVTESAMVLGASIWRRTVVIDFTALGSVIAVSALLIVLYRARRGAVRESTALTLASLQEEAIVEEARLLGHASSLLHDTVLGDLHAIAMLAPGPIPHSHLAVIRRDLDLLESSGDLLRAPASGSLPDLIESTSTSALARMLARVGSRGLRVVVSGDPAVLAELDPVSEAALVGAAEQCLVNVVLHADVTLAELAILASGDEVTATIADSGRGFTVSKTPEDRLGLRLSVHDRMRGVGGSATVWSMPGAGTSVLLTVPMGRA